MLLCVGCAQRSNFSAVPGGGIALTDVTTTRVGYGWAANSVNATIFRKNSVVSDGTYQYTAYYDQEAYLVLAKRTLGDTVWQVIRTSYQGNVRDAHNSISMMVDGAGFLHVAWDQHDNPLHYARSIAPDTLALGEMESMTGVAEGTVSYPEFYKLPGGDLLFFYRSGSSGNGNLIINRYYTESGQWERIQSRLLDGQGERNAYWQACVDRKGMIHLSWVWRETWDVASNHDLSYARSGDGGLTWEDSRGNPYELPVTIHNAERILEIPQGSELINQTAISTDAQDRPAVATYFRSEDTGKPEFHVIYQRDSTWNVSRVSSRQSDFSLGGGGTKRIPVSRPQLIFSSPASAVSFAALICRDSERENRPSLYYNLNFPEGSWEVSDLSTESLGSWEPSYDTERWMKDDVLSLFIQKVEQIDGEGLSAEPPQIVRILDWKP